MIGYMTLGTNDIDKARGFYDALLSEIGAKRIVDEERITIWGKPRTSGMLAVIKPYDGERATIGNGTMTAIIVDNVEMVAKMHKLALSLGGTDEGAPGPRGTAGNEFAYCRDPEGHKLAFFSIAPRG